MRYILSSIFRNSSGYVDRYFRQVDELAVRIQALGHSFALVLAEGDSQDNSFHTILNYAEAMGYSDRLILLKVDHGGPVFGSVDHTERWSNISRVCNALLEQLPRCDRWIYVESDLIWNAGTMLRLLDDIDTHDLDAVAPMCFHRPTGLFYDTWGFRAHGLRFSQEFPYSPCIPYGALNFEESRPVLDSAGSCLVMKGEVARVARFVPPERCIVGFCEDIFRHEYTLYLNPNEQVLHP